MENVKYVVVNGMTYDIPEGVESMDDVRAAAVAIDPGLSNADAIVTGDTVGFTYRAGTKGAENILDTVKAVVINNQQYDIPEGVQSIEDIRAAAVQIDPGLSNADAIVEDGQVVFRYRAGTKG